MDERVIALTDLTKQYGRFTAVDRICLTIRKGEIFGLLAVLSTVAVFTRNVAGPMDFTPTVLNSAMEVYGNHIPRVTTAAFELALPVVFYSPIQHLGIVPENLHAFPQFVWDYLRDAPLHEDAQYS